MYPKSLGALSLPQVTLLNILPLVDPYIIWRHRDVSVYVCYRYSGATGGVLLWQAGGRPNVP
jgi:hypothetical protein